MYCKDLCRIYQLLLQGLSCTHIYTIFIINKAQFKITFYKKQLICVDMICKINKNFQNYKGMKLNKYSLYVKTCTLKNIMTINLIAWNIS